MLSSNQLWWSVVKEKQGITSQERVLVLTKPCGNLAVSSQEKADLAEVFSEKMRNPEPDRWSLPLPRLGTSNTESMVITEAAVRRHLKGVNVKKASGPDGVSPHLLKHCAVEQPHCCDGRHTSVHTADEVVHIQVVATPTSINIP